MTIRKSLLSPILGKAKGSLVLLPALAVVVMVTSADSSPARAGSASPVVSAAKVRPHSAKPARVATEPAKTTKKTIKKTAAKMEPRPRTANKSANSPAATAAKPTQVMDFDTDEVEGQRLEPGFDLIQASPRRARHPSLVSFSPKPEDSVVKGD